MMFSNFGFGEIVVLAIAGLLIFGPEKLPRAAMDAARIIRKLRSMADSAVDDFKTELPDDLTSLDLRALHPRRIIENALSESNPSVRTTGLTTRASEQPRDDLRSTDGDSRSEVA